MNYFIYYGAELCHSRGEPKALLFCILRGRVLNNLRQQQVYKKVSISLTMSDLLSH